MKNKITKLPSIIVGIPAYNEEENIKQLLMSIINQNTTKFKLKKIIVVSDHSTDSTERMVRSVKNSLIKLIVTGERIGKYHALNLIMNESNSDVLVTLDADTKIKDKNFLYKISKPIFNDKNVGVVGAATVNVEPKTYFEKIISDSHKIKTIIFKKINNSNNVFLSHGRAIALNKRFYKTLKLLVDYPTDAQMYLFCLKNNMKFKYEEKAKVLFRSPTTISDHRKQHDRFVSGKTSFENLLSKEFVEKQYHIPLLLLPEFLIRYFLMDPISMIGYSFVTLYITLFKSIKNYKSLWDISTSTKGGMYGKI